MSQKACEEFEEECRKLLYAQRVCAWCEQRFESAKELVDHILKEHPERKKAAQPQPHTHD